MDVETSRENFCINKIIEQKKESFSIENGVIIPDVKPDVLNTICTNGTICLYKKEVQDGMIKIDGTINTYIMYFADSELGSIRSISTNIDFSRTIEMKQARTGMDIELDLQLKELECKVINERKINIEAVIEVDVQLFDKENVEIIKSIENIKDIQILDNNTDINIFVGEGIAKTYAKDTLNVDNTEKIAEIMKCNLCVKNKETKISYNKVLMKADMEIKLLYLTDDNKINVIERTIPIMGFVDVKDVNDNDFCDVKYEIKNLLIKQNSTDENSIYVEIEIEMNCRVYETKSINIIKDLYSPTIVLRYDRRKIKMMQNRKIIQDICNIRENQILNDIGNNKIYDVEIKPKIVKQNVLNNKIIYECEIDLNFIYSSNIAGGIDTKKVSIPFNFEMELDTNDMNSNTSFNTNIEIGMNNFVVMPDESIDIKIDLIFSTEYSRTAEIGIIENIQSDEIKQENPYSMTVYFTKPNDDLWMIAKKYRSTIEDIQRVNGIEKDEKINTGMQLFIPRYNG